MIGWRIRKWIGYSDFRTGTIISSFSCSICSERQQQINSHRSSWNIFIACVLAMQQGCVSMQQYRGNLDHPKPPGTCKANTEPSQCEAIEVGPDTSPSAVNHLKPFPILGVIEFDDSGLLFDPDQPNKVLRFLSNASSEARDHAGVILVVFAHGWAHNARADDDNFVFFRRTLETIANHENLLASQEERKPRIVEGVYLGWRGQSYNLFGLEKLLTFYSRKEVSHRIGERDASQVLMQLHNMAYGIADGRNGLSMDGGGDGDGSSLVLAHGDARQNRMLIIGHSMGAALVYSAVSQLITEELIEPTPKGAPHLADAIILLNPAFEAIRAYPMFSIVGSNSQMESRPKVSIFTSDSDFATKLAFSAAEFADSARHFSAFDYRQAKNPIRLGDQLSEYDASARAIGHYDPLLTHFLVLANSEIGRRAQCASSPDSLVEIDVTAQRRSEMTNLSQAGNQLNDHLETQKQLLDKAYSSATYTHLDFGKFCLVVANPEFAVKNSGYKFFAPLKDPRLSIFNVSMAKDIWDGHDLDQGTVRTDQFLEFMSSYIPFSVGEGDF